MSYNSEASVSKSFSIFINILLFIEALFTTVVISQFGEIFSELEKEIPLITKFVLLSPFYIWCLPVLGVLMYKKNIKKGKGAGYVYITVFIIGLLWLPLAVYSLYLPLF